MLIEINATIFKPSNGNIGGMQDEYQIKVTKNTLADKESATEAIKDIIAGLTEKP